MLQKKSVRTRLHKLTNSLNQQIYQCPHPLAVSYIYSPKDPIPYEKAVKGTYKPIKVGQQWSKHKWASAWFRLEGTIPRSFSGKEVVARINISSEGCVFKNGTPYQTLTMKGNTAHIGKQHVSLHKKARGGEKISLMVEGAANGLFGSPQDGYALAAAELAWYNRTNRKLQLDILTLLSMTEDGILPENSPRFKRILRGLHEVANTWDNGKGIHTCLKITQSLLSVKAAPGATTMYSIGHAHLDLGWLWPVRETKRKGGRTFSTALRMMEDYPEYKFGASQPQLFKWVKECYPALYADVKRAIKAKRFECQGAMWCEPDMNITGGESLVRQCLYGKRFFQKEFGIDVRNLWLPDVFGYSAALPQILKKSGVDFFMTQKISWNDVNTFPHHTFIWEGIDGTEIKAHFLPGNSYNTSNEPRQLVKAEQNYSQSDVSNEFLNLYGIGDGGGGPGESHIEFGLRQQDLEGTPKFKFAFAEDFFKVIDKIPTEKLERWVGELYLEFHRGTYTTQARMKKQNRQLELALRDTEFLSVVADTWVKRDFDAIWETTLLNQFHDILPGSSISWVYADAHRESKQNLGILGVLRSNALTKLHGKGGAGIRAAVVYNTLNWDRKEVVTLTPPKGLGQPMDSSGRALPWCRAKQGVQVMVSVPSMGYTTVSFKKADSTPAESLVKATTSRMENDKVRISLKSDGTIGSLYDKEQKREMLSGPANVLMLWEDKPTVCDAWDIMEFYRESPCEQARRTSVKVKELTTLSATICQELSIGISRITQEIILTAGSGLLRIKNRVDWKETNRVLKVSSMPAVFTNEATYEIQFGTIKRPTHRNTSWDRARFEVPGQRFADVSQADTGLAIINDCKYGYSALGRTFELTLLRSPKSPDPKADMHEHTFTFGYYPHAGPLENSDVFQTAHSLNNPLIIHPVIKEPVEKMKSYFSVEGELVKIETVKKAEDGNGIIIRMYEPLGKDAKVTFISQKKWNSFTECNLLEEPVGKAKKSGTKTELSFKPFEIRTFLLGI